PASGGPLRGPFPIHLAVDEVRIIRVQRAVDRGHLLYSSTVDRTRSMGPLDGPGRSTGCGLGRGSPVRRTVPVLLAALVAGGTVRAGPVRGVLPLRAVRARPGAAVGRHLALLAAFPRRQPVVLLVLAVRRVVRPRRGRR